MPGGMQFLIVCGPLLGLLLLAAIVLGLRARLAFARRLGEAMKNEDSAGRLRSGAHLRKQTVLLSVALASLLGGLFLTFLLWIHVLSVSAVTVGLLGAFIIMMMISGGILLIEFERLAG